MGAEPLVGLWLLCCVASLIAGVISGWKGASPKRVVLIGLAIHCPLIILAGLAIFSGEIKLPAVIFAEAVLSVWIGFCIGGSFRFVLKVMSSASNDKAGLNQET